MCFLFAFSWWVVFSVFQGVQIPKMRKHEDKLAVVLFALLHIRLELCTVFFRIETILHFRTFALSHCNIFAFRMYMRINVTHMPKQIRLQLLSTNIFCTIGFTPCHVLWHIINLCLLNRKSKIEKTKCGNTTKRQKQSENSKKKMWEHNKA